CRQDFQGGTIKWRSGIGIIDCSRLKCVALTFDDGPGPYTSRLLDTLDAQNVQSTFFVVGQNVGNYPSTEQRAFRNGNEVMNHSWSHPDLTTLSYSSIVSQLSSTSNVIQSTVGKRPSLMRPPYGAYNSTVTSISRDQGMAVITWSVDTLDWKYRDSAYVRNAAVANTTSGSIVLMHDIHPTTVDAVPGIISDLKARGYVLVTVTDLLGAPQPGVVYSRR
ncbi:Peptidoglycan/xylan/chitin deacetylase, PgdA/CDA1 family, partial [Raineyella antarctica]